ncbi:unnamed protein product [Albugo candida]|uniref:Uncharacterized protein n=1 Tax=Albugo candida TaxID=65357 RepID=A0A024FY95_9STRA|nr:unnamed protein product [Albugo candida]|eukprot:CCI39559.1 unnamed protein product [Albugo candida]
MVSSSLVVALCASAWIVYGKIRHEPKLPLKPDPHFPFCIRSSIKKAACQSEEGFPLACISMCPFNYPVKCGPYCLPQSSDCKYFFISRIGAVAGAALRGVSSGFVFFQLLARIRPSLQCLYYAHDLIEYTIKSYQQFAATFDTDADYAPFKQRLVASLCTPIFVLRVEHMMRACGGHNLDNYWPLQPSDEMLDSNKAVFYSRIILKILGAKADSSSLTSIRSTGLVTKVPTYFSRRDRPSGAYTRVVDKEEREISQIMGKILDFLRAFNLDQVLHGLSKEERTLVQNHVSFSFDSPSELLGISKDLEAAYEHIKEHANEQTNMDGIKTVKSILRKLRTTKSPLSQDEQEALDAIAVAIHAEAYANSLTWIDKAKLYLKHRGATVKTLFENAFYVGILDAIPLLDISGLTRIARTLLSVKCFEIKDTNKLVRLSQELATKFVVVADGTAFNHDDARWRPNFNNGNITIQFANEDDVEVIVNIHSGGTAYKQIPIQPGTTHKWTEFLHVLQDKTLYIDRWRRYYRGVSLTIGGSLLFWVPHVFGEGKGQLTMNVYVVKPT